MSIKDMRLKYVFLWATVALLLLSIGNRCFQTYVLKRSLEKNLAQTEGVTEAHVAFKQDGIVVCVRLEYVDNLADTYLNIENETKSVLGKRRYEIDVEDKSDENLDDAYASIHYYIEEARVRGNYGQMVDKANSVLANAAVQDYRVSVDGENIYVQMRLNDHYLYRIRRLRGCEGGTQS